MKLKNQKGITLVALVVTILIILLLAVIVILALIMSIAIVSMTGIMQGARESTFKETASQIISGVRSQLTLSMETVTMAKSSYDGNGQVYFFERGIIEKGGQSSPLGGEIQYISAPETSGTNAGKSNVNSSGTASYIAMTKIGSMGIYRSSANVTCSDSVYSFVRFKNGTSGNLEYSICLTAGSGYKYIRDTEGTEANLLNGSNTTMIKP